MSGARVIVAYLAHLSHNFRGVEVNFHRITLLLKLCQKISFLEIMYIILVIKFYKVNPFFDHLCISFLESEIKIFPGHAYTVEFMKRYDTTGFYH